MKTLPGNEKPRRSRPRPGVAVGFGDAIVQEVEPPSVADPKEIFIQYRRTGSRDNLQHNLSRIVLNEIQIASQDEPAPYAEVEWPVNVFAYEVAAHQWNLLGAFPAVGVPVPFTSPVIPDLTTQPVKASRIAAQTECFVERAGRLDRRGKTDVALDLIYDTVDEWMIAGDFDRLDFLLASVAADDYSADILLGLLTASLPGRTRLPSRRKLYSETERILKQRGQWEDGLLTGLEQ